MKPYLVLFAVLSFSSSLHAENYVVSQKDKNFSPAVLKIKAGDSVEFRNDDAFAHNVFSLSDATSFDLGSYPKGESRKVTFEQPGTVDVECAVHPSMKMQIEVSQ